ncbi:MAG: glycosyltransferase family 4 protein [Desulfobacterota bacterium]|jgi:glycosyltransferase involved in cell wall biosynthesis|nr:glycosyltransferase family 4 protein [Thermodesulfobacteriota bacterium]
MKILFLSKRRPQGKDLFTRPYGRFFHIPRILSERGHDVALLLLSYRKEVPSAATRYGMKWIMESVFPSGPFAYIRRAENVIRDFKPDWIVGFSDTYYGILAAWLGKRHGIGSVIDAYDNYESYIPWLKPLHLLWRKAISKATLLTAAGPHLAEFMASGRRDRKARTVPMAADPHFKPLDRLECRRKLGLPTQAKIIGTCGAVHSGRGIDLLFRAYDRLKSEHPQFEMVLTGHRQRGMSIPSGVRWLGYLPDEDMPFLLNSLDVLIVLNQLSDFGKFSYPVKLYEAMRSRIPVVATDTAPARWILEDREAFLARPADSADLADKIQFVLTLDHIDYGHENTWEHSCLVFEQALLSPHAGPPSRRNRKAL